MRRLLPRTLVELVADDYEVSDARAISVQENAYRVDGLPFWSAHVVNDVLVVG